jgi:hypothetical protein
MFEHPIKVVAGSNVSAAIQAGSSATEAKH